MLNGTELYERFREFGQVLIEPVWPYHSTGFRLTLYFQPPGTKTDTETRRAMYDLAETVIEIARTEYELTRAPELTITGEIRYIRYKSPRNSEQYIVTEGRLELCFTERGNNGLPIMP